MGCLSGYRILYGPGVARFGMDCQCVCGRTYTTDDCLLVYERLLGGLNMSDKLNWLLVGARVYHTLYNMTGTVTRIGDTYEADGLMDVDGTAVAFMFEHIRPADAEPEQVTTSKPSWLKATRTVGGEEVVNLRVDTGPESWYGGKPHLIGEIRRNGFLYTCAWSIARGTPIEQFSKYHMQSLSLASIPTEPEAVCECKVEEWGTHAAQCWARNAPAKPAKCTRCLGTGEYKDGFSGSYFVCDSCAPAAKPVVKVCTCGRDKYHLITCDLWSHTQFVSEAPEAPKPYGQNPGDWGSKEHLAACEADETRRKREGMRKLVEVSEEAGAYEAPTLVETGTPGVYREVQRMPEYPAEAEWKPAVGQGALWVSVHDERGTEVNVRGFSADGKEAYIEVEDGTYTRAPLDELRKPAPRTRDVVVMEMRHRSGHVVWVSGEGAALYRPSDYIRTGRTHIFPGVPVDDKAGE